MKEIESHYEFLHEKIFQTKTKWPQFKRMLEDVRDLSIQLPQSSNVIILERAYVYGGNSLFAPLFHQHQVTSVDCEIPTTTERRGYQKSWTEDPRCIQIPAQTKASITKTGLPHASADLLLVPNVVHHEPDQEGMFEEIARLLRPGGTGYIFEALIRELHQIPDDYIRYTPWGFQKILARHGLEMTEWKPTGGPFEAISYCWIQALQFIPESERGEKEKWFFTEHLPELLEMDKRYTTNISRPHTTFPVAYSIYFRKS